MWEKGHYVFGLNASFDATTIGGSDYWGAEELNSTEFKRPQFNGCTHRKDRMKLHTFTLAGYQKKSVTNRIWMPCRSYFGSNSGTSQGTIMKHTPQDWTNAQHTAWNVMQPEFEGQISMFNFIAELRDFKSLARLLYKHPLRKLRNFFRRKRKSLLSSRTLAEAHLMNEFALKPLLADIYKITCQMEEIVRDAQTRFADAGTGRNSRHWTESRVIDDGSLSYGGYYYYYKAEGTVEVQKFTATMEYSYDYSARGPINAFMRYWGLIPTWEALWNVVPWTFVVDYFIKIGNSIAAMEHDPNVDVLMRQYCESILTLKTSGIHLVTDECHNKVTVVDGKVRKDPLPLVSGFESSLYTRRVCQPKKGMVIPSVQLASSRQALNLAALLRCFF
jgi:hypothetical protein